MTPLDDSRRSPDGTCWGFEDGLDGFVVHAPNCSRAGQSYISGSSCIGYTTWRGPWPDWARGKKEAEVSAMARDEGCDCDRTDGSLLAEHDPACETTDDTLLADILRRALKNNLLSTKGHFFPTWHVTMEPGSLMDAQEIVLTDAEIDALRRTV